MMKILLKWKNLDDILSFDSRYHTFGRYNTFFDSLSEIVMEQQFACGFYAKLDFSDVKLCNNLLFVIS